MARVTVEDCIEKISNRFDLVMLSAHRAREIAAGAPLTVERDNDKNPVVALREIAEGTVKPEALEESLIRGMQRHADYDEAEDQEDISDLYASEQRVLGVDAGAVAEELESSGEEQDSAVSTDEMAEAEAERERAAVAQEQGGEQDEV